MSNSLKGESLKCVIVCFNDLIFVTLMSNAFCFLKIHTNIQSIRIFLTKDFFCNWWWEKRRMIAWRIFCQCSLWFFKRKVRFYLPKFFFKNKNDEGDWCFFTKIVQASLIFISVDLKTESNFYNLSFDFKWCAEVLRMAWSNACFAVVSFFWNEIFCFWNFRSFPKLNSFSRIKGCSSHAAFHLKESNMTAVFRDFMREKRNLVLQFSRLSFLSLEFGVCACDQPRLPPLILANHSLSLL